MVHHRAFVVWLVLLLLSTVLTGATNAQTDDEILIFERLARYDPPVALENVAAVGERVYLTYGRSLQVLDVSNPQSPVLLGEYTSAVMGQFMRLHVAEALAYIPYSRPGHAGGGGGLQIIDVRDPTTPILVGSYTLAKAAYDVAVVGQRAYLTYHDPAGGGFAILDVSQPTAPRLLGQVSMEQRVNSIAVQGTLAYLAADTNGAAPGGLQIMDVRDPTTPTLVGSYELELADAVQVVGNRVYVGYVDTSISPLGGGQFLILDVNNPETPTLLGSIGGGVTRIQVVGDVAYLAGGGITGFIDVSDPTQMHSLTERRVSHPHDIAVVGEHVYITSLQLHIGRVSTLSSEPVTNMLCFPESEHCISGRMRAYWEQHGGLPVFGVPLAPRQFERREARLRQAQWFERHRLELHPENAPPYDVLLGRLGVEVLGQQGREWQTFPPGVPQPGCRYLEATHHNICGEFLAAWQAHGLDLDGQPGVTEAESLALFGLPLSEAQPETLSDGRVYTVQWFERARFELHPENPPPYRVLFGRLGAEVYHE